MTAPARGPARCPGRRGRCATMAAEQTDQSRETGMSKRGRKKRDRKKSGANHGKRPNS